VASPSFFVRVVRFILALFGKTDPPSPVRPSLVVAVSDLPQVPVLPLVPSLVLEEPKVVAPFKRSSPKDEAMAKYRAILEAVKGDVPLDLLFAVGWMESGFNSQAYRYEPNYDVRYLRVKKTVDLNGPRYQPYVMAGLTIEEWFVANDKRAKERIVGRDYSWPAQTRIASSYGIMQLMYPTAVSIGFQGTPEDLYDAETNCRLGATGLAQNLRRYKGCVEDAVAAYNAGSPRRTLDGKYVNQGYVDTIMALQRMFKQILG